LVWTFHSAQIFLCSLFAWWIFDYVRLW